MEASRKLLFLSHVVLNGSILLRIILTSGHDPCSRQRGPSSTSDFDLDGNLPNKMFDEIHFEIVRNKFSSRFLRFQAFRLKNLQLRTIIIIMKECFWLMNELTFIPCFWNVLEENNKAGKSQRTIDANWIDIIAARCICIVVAVDAPVGLTTSFL